MLKTASAREISMATIFNTMRILKKVNQGDQYLEAYKGHLHRSGEDFYDIYMLMWDIAQKYAPKRILEIGTRTGISLCQLLSAYIDTSAIERIVSVDLFDDGFISPALVKRNLNYLNLPADKVEFRKGDSRKILHELYEEGATFSYILVDGGHDRDICKADLDNAHALLEIDGLLICDDVSDNEGECNLIGVWNDFINSHPGKYQTFVDMAGKGCALGVRL